MEEVKIHKLQNLHEGTNIVTFNRMEETTRIVGEIVENMDEYTLDLLLGGTENDLDAVFQNLMAETYDVLYGSQKLVGESSARYINELQTAFEETLRVESFPYFLVSVFPDFDLNWHHVEWAHMAQLYKKLCIIAARDHGKSYFWSNVYLIWRMYRYKSKREFTAKPRRDLSIMSERGALITNEKSLAIDLMEILKDTIEGNEILAERLVPDTRNNWGVEKIKAKNGARLMAKSYGTKFRGRHPGYAVIDDFLDDSALYSKDQRDKFINYFHSVIMNAILKGGDAKIVGTPFHANDLYGDLKGKQGWRVFEYPSVYPDGKALWAHRYNINDLLEKREDQGSIIFSREHLVRPVVSDSSLFPHDLIQKSFFKMQDYKLVKNRDEFPIRFPTVVTGCDFAMSGNVGADFSVFLTWGIDDHGAMWLLHMWRVKGRKYGEQLAMLKAINRNFRPDLFFVESNQFQQIFADGAEEAGLPVVPHHTGSNKHNLQKGLPSLVVLFERNKIKLPRGDEFSRSQTDIIASELMSVAWTDKGLQGVGEHDDCPMAMWQSSLAARYVKHGLSLGFLN